jgi:hypothetical protein
MLYHIATTVPQWFPGPGPGGMPLAPKEVGAEDRAFTLILQGHDMKHRRGISRFNTIGSIVLAAAAVAAAACSEDPGPRGPGIAKFTGPASHHVGCNAGRKFTGGGRVDPVDIGKVTFGFNVHGDDVCDGTGGPKGQLQVVYHYNQTIYHTITIEHFSSFTDPEKGECGEFDGTARSKSPDTGDDWHYHHYFAEVCDKAEPGHGADRFTFLPDGAPPEHQNVWAVPLTGGNIQAHKN